MKRLRNIKRITAVGMAMSLFLTGDWTVSPIQAYAGPMLSPTADVLLPSEAADQRDGENAPEQGLSAILGGVEKYFMSLQGNSRAGSQIVPGLSLAEKTTSLTFPATDGTYYLVIPSDSGQTVTTPESHAAALNAGWIRKLGTDGSFVWTGLSWNTSYDVYGTDLTSVTTLGEHILTNKGRAGGTILMEGDLLTGESITASLDSTAPTGEGTWSWYYGDSAASGLEGWVEITSGQPTGTLTIPGPETVGGKYLKAVFSAAGNYEGSVEQVSADRAASRLTAVVINHTAPVIGEVLEASAVPSSCEDGVIYNWYQQNDGTIQSDLDTLVYSGKNYTVQADDIGKKLYVRANSLENSVSRGTVTSEATETVISQKADTAGLPELTGKTDVSITVKMPEGSTGLYQFAWSTTPNWSPVSDSHTVYETKTRDTLPLTIQGLNPSTDYYIRVRQVGENGWLDSDWGEPLQIQTLAPALRGRVLISGTCAYGKSLTASLEIPEENGKGSFHWYRGEDTAEIAEADGQAAYTLKQEDIGCQIRVIYRANGTAASGEINGLSDLVEKAEREAPAAFQPEAVAAEDTSLSFSMPSGFNGVIAGYAETESEVPVEAVSGRVYNEGENVTLQGLERNTDYYLFLKYAETGTHKESDWSAPSGPKTTKRTDLSASSCSISFSPENPAPNNTLTAVLKDLPGGEAEGVWAWTENLPGGGSRQLSFQQDIDEPLKTSYTIPADSADETTYTVTFTGEGGLEGSVTATSNPVKSPEKTPHQPPAAPGYVEAGDTSLTVKMEGVTDGIYSFSYSADALAAEADRILVSGRYYGGSSAVITGLDRNRTYYVWARQEASGDYEASAWSEASEGYRTVKTDIGGTVSLTGESLYSHTLTASYEQASYLPAGNDSGGSFSWYRGTVPERLYFQINGTAPVAAEPVYSVIAGAVSETYEIQAEDIDCYVKAQYQGTGDFQGTKEAVSQLIKKNTQSNPSAGVLALSDDPAAGGDTMELQLDQGSYYQVRKSTDEIPAVPETVVAAQEQGWKKAESGLVTVRVCYTSSGEEALQANTKYTVYTVLPGSSFNQPSSVVMGNTLESGQYKQTGNLVYQSGWDTVGGLIPVGETLKANLENANSGNGTWTWFASVQDYLQVTEGTEPEWTQLVSGYVPTSDGGSSLTLTEELAGHYVRAEFTADPKSGYAGTIDQDGSGNRCYGQYVRRIYKETITLESSNSDGYGEPAAYQNTVITGTVNEFAEKAAVTGTRTVTFQANGTDIAVTVNQDQAAINKFTCTLPLTTEWDGQAISATVTVPSNSELYVTEDKQLLTAAKISSVTDSSAGIPYKYGIPISTGEELVEFLNKTGAYTNWSGETYVLTDHISYPEEAAAAGNDAQFEGTLNGDYHKISGLKDAMFRNLGTATIENVIMNQINIDKPSGSESVGAAGVIALRSYGTAKLKRVFLSQAVVSGGHDVGYFIGKIVNGNITINECIAVGGSVDSKQNAKVIGGVVGYTNGRPVTMNNIMSLKVNLYARGGNNTIGGAGVAYGGRTDLYNVLVASQFSGSYGGNSGGIIGTWSGNASGGDFKAIYYDATLAPGSVLSNKTCKGSPVQTAGLIGEELKTSFDANLSGASETVWTYTDGFYPRLNWVAEDPVCALFAATRGAFTSTDGKTAPADMFSGTLHGAIEVPLELQKEGYSYSADGCLKVDDSGQVIPTGTGAGRVIISYQDELMSAENTYEFTVADTTEVMNKFDSVKILNGGAARIGTTLQAQAVAAASDSNPPSTSDITYQWYRRKSGSDKKELIKDTSGSAYTGSTYTVRTEDSRSAIMVKAKAPGYFEMGSSFTSLIEIIAPSEAPEVEVIDYQTVEITGKGGAIENYEFAYAKPGGTKIEVSRDSTSQVTQTITGLEADTAYEFYSRIPEQTDGETVMAASGWSAARTATTGKIPLEGELTISGEASVNQTVAAEIPNTNLQTGTWSAELVKAGEAGRTVTDKLITTDYRAEYVILAEDMGGKVKFTFTPTSPYGGTAKTAETAEIKAAVQAAPAAPVFSEATDSTIYLSAYADDPTNVTYEYGLKGPYDSEIRTIAAADAVLSGNRIAIRSLTRNTSYEIYARRKIRDGYQVGRWSAGLTASTKRTDISTLSPVFSSDNLQVEGTVTATAPVISGAAVTGSWKLERIESLGSKKRASISGYSVSDDGLTITYILQPMDASYLLQATFVGSGDFEGNATAATAQKVQKKRYTAPLASDFSLVSWNDSGITVKITEGKEGTFQFGYQTGGGDIIPCNESLQQGASFTITPLNRYTAYGVCMRRLAETGYTDSGWSFAQSVTLKKTEINGTLQIQGSARAGETLKAVYEAGNYSAPADSDGGGSFSWRIVDGAGITETYAGENYSVKEGDRGKTVSVVYEPPSSSKFKGSIEKKAGVVLKKTAAAPAVPVVLAVEDMAKGSSLQISNAESGVWYRACLASDPKPALVMEEDAAAAGWIKTETTAPKTIGGLLPNTDYIIYGARMETDSTAASILTSSKKVKSGKETLSSEILVSDQVRPMTGTRAAISTFNEPPDGTWYWYVSTDQAAENWKMIRSSRAVTEGGASADTFEIPYDYSGYYLKIVFLADGDYTGEKTWNLTGTLEKRRIAGTVKISPEAPILFEKLTAVYDGTDDLYGTWIWYREESDGTWTAIDRKLYENAGTTSSYTAGEADKGKVLKAEYTAGSFGCEGSVSQTCAAIGAALQNTPEAPKVLQTIGTSVQLTDSAPSQAKPYGERPAVVFGCKKAGDTGEIRWNPAEEAWFRHLAPNSEYEFYTRYLETNVYTESRVSPGVSQPVGSGTISQSNISLVYESDDDSRLDVGKKVQAVYNGEGYGEGSWKVSLSTGKELTGDQFTTKIQTDPDGQSGKAICTYVIDMNAVSSTILFTYTANDGNYTGTATARTDQAVRKPVPATPEKPVVAVHEDTDFYLEGVKSTQEYALTRTPEVPGRYSGLWKILPEAEVDAGGRYIYTNLERDTTYYVHTRVAETDSQEVSETATSDPVTTLPYFGLGELILANEQELRKQPKTESIMDMPETLEQNGTLALENVTLKPERAGGYEPAQLLEPYDSFVNTDGSVSPNVFEKGSSWANDHYGTVLEVLDGSGQVIGSNHEDPTVLTWSGRADKLRISLYRANAVTKGGSYIWEFLLKDSAENTALFHGEVTILTQLEATVPLLISLQIEDQEIRQTTNGAGLKNSNGMPVEVSVDAKPGAGPDMPKLLGEPAESDPALMAPGAVYLKLSVDNSIETGRVTDLWLDTTLSSASIRPLVKLGASSQADYYISGIISENGTVNWPWPSDGSRTIEEAYQLKFVYEISVDGYPVYTPGISSREFIPALQEGGES